MKRLERNTSESDERDEREETEERDETKKIKQSDCIQEMLMIDKKMGMLGFGANGTVWIACCNKNCGFVVKAIYLGDNQAKKNQFERQAMIAWYAGEHLAIGPNVYDYFEATMKDIWDDNAGFIISDRLNDTIGNIFEYNEINKRKQMKYCKRIMEIVKTLSENHFINEDPNPGNWMVNQDDIIYLIDYDKVVQKNDTNYDLIYYYNLLNVQKYLFTSLHLDGDVVEKIQREIQQAINNLNIERGKLADKIAKINEDVSLLILNQDVDNIIFHM
jgi:serine/threonine protein kinase